MAVRIRLKRMGRRNRAFFRIVAADSRATRDGRAIERLGWYDPLVQDEKKKVSLVQDRIEYWLGVGAKPSETVESILRSRGVAFPDSLKGTSTDTEKRKVKRRAASAKAGRSKKKVSGRKAKKAAAKKAAAKK